MCSSTVNSTADMNLLSKYLLCSSFCASPYHSCVWSLGLLPLVGDSDAGVAVVGVAEGMMMVGWLRLVRIACILLVIVKVFQNLAACYYK